MCELLGLCFNRPVRPHISFRGFRQRGPRNPHGWGIARYEGRACQVFKEPLRATNSGLAEFVRDYEMMHSNLFVAHVRYASRGEHTLANTHPFVRTFRQREVVLAHNGTVQLERSDGLKFHPVGETDSELLLCHLLTALSRQNIALTDYREIERELRAQNEHGRMNVLFSDGNRLFCYRDAEGYNGLSVVERRFPFGHIKLRDEDWRVDLSAEKAADEHGVVVASQPLTNEEWFSLEAGALQVYEDGALVYGGCT